MKNYNFFAIWSAKYVTIALAPALLNAINDLDIPAIWFWPNVDAGTDEVSKAIRVFRETKNVNNMQFLIYLKSEYFLNLLRKTACLVGNSSAGIKECSYLGIPVVNIGSRQNNRMKSSNVIDSGYSSEEIKKAVNFQLKNGVWGRPRLSWPPLAQEGPFLIQFSIKKWPLGASWALLAAPGPGRALFN